MLPKWEKSQEIWTHQHQVTPCARCGCLVHPTLAINQEGKIYCAECVKAISLSSNLNDLEPRRGESMDEWLARWKQYRERCIDEQLAKVPSGPKKKVRFRLQN